jgi:hypothetical protein
LSTASPPSRVIGLPTLAHHAAVGRLGAGQFLGQVRPVKVSASPCRKPCSSSVRRMTPAPPM